MRYKLFKRTIDLFIALVVLIILSPLFLLIIIILRFTAEGHIFYRQKRVGYKNQYFEILKFATMLKDSPNMLTGSLTVRNDPRVTKIGRYLRITKINELPQVLNVLKGDMSIVGPRPQMKVDFDVFPPHVQNKIYDSKPGITGIGSIVFRDEEKLMTDSDMPVKEFYAKKIAPYKGTLELWYQSHASLYTDLMIIFLTAWVIIFPSSNLHYKIFNDLPELPADLQYQHSSI